MAMYIVQDLPVVLQMVQGHYALCGSEIVYLFICGATGRLFKF